MVGGAYAFARYTGIVRHTKDFDVFLRPADRDRAEELVTALIEVYGAGLARILEMVGDDTARTLAGDDLVGSLKSGRGGE